MLLFPTAKILAIVALGTAAHAKGAVLAAEAGLATILQILELPEQRIDLAKAKLAIDHMIDPQIDVAVSLKQLDTIATQVQALLPATASSHDKLVALRKYIYEPGAWNGGRPFEYDLEDPLGQDIRTKLLPTYLATRKGNCISMPFLFIIIGQKLGIDVTAAAAPNHVLVKYRHETGTWLNIEATSGGGFARDAWVQQEMPMTSQALSSGVYLRPLSKHETVVVMLSTLMEFYERKGWYKATIALGRLGLAHDPKSVSSMLRIAAGYGRQWDACVVRYPHATRLRDIPAFERASCARFYKDATWWRSQAEALGWRQSSLRAETAYLQRVSKVRATQNVAR